MRVTLAYINRVGISSWPQRERFVRRNVRIWSAVHHAWWRPNAAGYTVHVEAAGIYDFVGAYDLTKHCGPEKKISYHVVPWRSRSKEREGGGR